MGISNKDKVNLDALIRRQDLEVITAERSANFGEGDIPVSELAQSKLYYQLLRKPHFQRETDDWGIDNVVTLIKSFRDGNLIPALILWRNEQGFIFVIDGAHRLSALIAWVNDDYGDRNISAQFFMNEIPKKQREIAEACRRRVDSEVGSYASLSQILTSPNPSPEQIKWAGNLTKAMMTQWVHGDADMAAASFLTINQRAVEIDPTERLMIEARNQPNVIAARAFVNSTRGHKYWQKFDEGTRERVEKKAKLIYNAIFEPEDAEPSRHTHLPPAGLAHTANGLRIALDLVNLTNEVKIKLPADAGGSETERFINKTYGVVKYIAGSEPASLDLHPAVYFWGATGNHQPSIFLAVVSFVQSMVQQNELILFTTHRARFEEFLVGNSSIVKHILGRHGGWKKSVAPVKAMMRAVFDGLVAGKSDDEIEAELGQKFNNSSSRNTGDIPVEQMRTTWRETKAAARRRASIEVAYRCSICKARLDPNTASDDHVQRREDGGADLLENAQLTHHFCNHGFKEHFVQRGIPLPDIQWPPTNA
jgi:hypothetical protein